MGSTIGVIVLDTLRYDTFVDEMTDVVDLATHSFERMYSTARWTSPAHASLFTGYYPTEVGVHAGQHHLATPEPVLAERLRSAGYHTVGLSENINVDSFFDFDRGFEQFVRGPNLRGRPERNTSGFDWKGLEKKIPDDGLHRPLAAAYHILRSDAPTLATLRTGFDMFRANGHSRDDIEWAIDVLDRDVDHAGDLFVFANFMTTHYPYDPPPDYSPCEPLYVSPMELALREAPVTEEEHERHLSNYRGAARYLDDALPRLIERIDWDLLFVVSDHGELFGEHGLRGHQYGVYEELLHVPAVAVGDLVSEGRTTAVTSLVDVHRTLLGVAGVDVDDAHRGVDLLDGPADDERAVYAESEGCEWYSPDATGIEARIPPSWNEPHYMVRDADAMLLVDKDGTRAVDPETGAERPEHRAELAEAVRRIRASRVDRAGDADERAIPDDVMGRLEQLGYR